VTSTGSGRRRPLMGVGLRFLESTIVDRTCGSESSQMSDTALAHQQLDEVYLQILRQRGASDAAFGAETCIATHGSHQMKLRSPTKNTAAASHMSLLIEKKIPILTSKFAFSSYLLVISTAISSRKFSGQELWQI